ncbi:hypothetical protein ACJBXQ_11285, partial [Streptococcus suis]
MNFKKIIYKKKLEIKNKKTKKRNKPKHKKKKIENKTIWQIQIIIKKQPTTTKHIYTENTSKS